MKAIKLKGVFEPNFAEDQDMDWYVKQYQDAAEASPDNKNHWARDNIPLGPDGEERLNPQPVYRHVDDEDNLIKDTMEEVEELLEEVLENSEVVKEVEEELVDLDDANVLKELLGVN